jgi:hypothetical protein
MKLLLALAACTSLLLAQGPSPTPGSEAGKPPEKPVTEKPASEKPTSDKPAADKPAPDKKPATDKPVDGKPADGKPVDGKPVESKPAEKDAAKEGKFDTPAADAPKPRGSDPSDIRAMQSAQAMIEAEKKLAAEIRAGKIKGLDKIVTFDEISSWPYEDRLKGMPKRCKELDGKKVMMTGFMLPIDEVQHIKEFLLVQSLWSCCYGQPPDINGFVRVVMPKGKTTEYFFDPLKVTGTFKVEATVVDGYCVDIYQLHAESIEAVK